MVYEIIVYTFVGAVHFIRTVLFFSISENVSKVNSDLHNVINWNEVIASAAIHTVFMHFLRVSGTDTIKLEGQKNVRGFYVDWCYAFVAGVTPIFVIEVKSRVANTVNLDPQHMGQLLLYFYYIMETFHKSESSGCILDANVYHFLLLRKELLLF